MLNVFIVVSVLCIIDLLLLLLMPGFYIKLGIPIYKDTIKLKEGKNINDVKVLMGTTRKFKVKIENNTTLFRTKFTVLNLYTLAFISIVKGEFSIIDNSIKIVQRINLSTVYFICLLAYVVFTQDIDNFGKGALIGFVVLLIFFHVKRNNEIMEIKNDIQETLGSEKLEKAYVE